MFIIWGKKLVYRKLGFVADFCPICRSIAAFAVKRVGLAGHVYYISMSEGELAGFERTCQTCATCFGTDTAKYREIASTLASLPELQAQTFPDIAVVLHDRLELEERLAKAPLLLSSEDRRSLILDTFLLLSPKVEKRYASTTIDMGVGLALLAAIVLMIAGPAVLLSMSPDADPGIPLLVCVVLGLGLVVWQIVVAKSRFMTREIVPLLVKALRPLKPAQGELQAATAELRAAGHKIGAKLKLPELAAKLT